MKKLKIPNLQEWFFQLSIVKNIISWSKRYAFPGFSNVPVHDIVTFTAKELQRYDLFTRANSIAFSFFLSLFPSLLALFTLIPLLKSYFIDYLPGGEEFDFMLRTSILDIMPGIAGEKVFDFIDEVTNTRRVGLLSFGFILAIFFASNGVLTLMRGFEKSGLKTFKTRNFLRKRIIAILLTFQMGGLLIASVVFVILGRTIFDFVSNYISFDYFDVFIINFIRWFAIILMFYSIIGIIYRYGAPVIQKFRFFSPGATLATILCILSSVGFSYYVDQIKTENQLYGTIWTIIVIMLWIQLNSLVLLIGFELNASIMENRAMNNFVEGVQELGKDGMKGEEE